MSSMILSSAHAFDVVLIERVPRPAARCSRPTASTPGQPVEVAAQRRVVGLAAEQLDAPAPAASADLSCSSFSLGSCRASRGMTSLIRSARELSRMLVRWSLSITTTPIPTTTTKAIDSDVKANQFASSARTIAAEITAIAAATSFDPNFKPTAGVSRPAGRVVAREDQVGERVEGREQRGGIRHGAAEGAPEVHRLRRGGIRGDREQGDGVHAVDRTGAAPPGSMALRRRSAPCYSERSAPRAPSRRRPRSAP